MKTVAVLVLIAITGLGLIWFSLNNLSPFNWEKLKADKLTTANTTQTQVQVQITELYERGELTAYLRSDVVTLLLTGVFTLVAGLIAAAHTALDKLFFRKFFQSPNMPMALRRGILWGSFPVVIIYLALIGYLNTTLLLLISGTYMLAEFGLSALLPFRKVETGK